MSMITELVKRLRKHADGDYREAADVIEELSAKLHVANMERSSQYYNGGWIPVSERLPLPEEYGRVLCYDDEGFIYTSDIFRSKGKICFGLTLPSQFVVAWMPLPTPYKGGDAE